MWGYPLWLFLGLWIVLERAQPLTRERFARIVAAWAVVFAVFAARLHRQLRRAAAYDHRYRAVFFPATSSAGDRARFRAVTGKPLAYVIGTMWDGGNVAHYAPEQPRVLIDGSPRRAPWIDLGDLRTQRRRRGVDRRRSRVHAGGVPRDRRRRPGAAAVRLPFRRGDGGAQVGWAMLRPRPAFAGDYQAFVAVASVTKRGNGSTLKPCAQLE